MQKVKENPGRWWLVGLFFKAILFLLVVPYLVGTETGPVTASVAFMVGALVLIHVITDKADDLDRKKSDP